MEREFKIPEGFKVTVDGKKLRVEYGGRFIEKQINYPSSIKLKVEDNKLIVSSEIERRKIKAMMGTLIAHVRNMVKGLKDGYTYRLKAVYTHFPMTIKVEGDEVIITNFLGERTVRKAKILGDTIVQVNGQEIIVKGMNKEFVAQTAANIENATRISKKDRRVFQDGIYIVGSE